MRIPRTNFPPVFSTDPDEAHPHPDQTHADGVRYDISWSDDGLSGARYAYGDPLPFAESDRSRFRSPILRASDPAVLVDGTLDSHFLMAPNVRFTRTPDRENYAKRQLQDIETIEPITLGAELEVVSQPEIAPLPEVASVIADAMPEPQTIAIPENVLPEPDQPFSVNPHVERLRAALAERRMMSWKSEAPAAEPAPVTQPVAAIAEAEPQVVALTVEPTEALPEQPTAVSATPQPAELRQSYLSDHAFWEAVAFDLQSIPMRSETVQPTVPQADTVPVPVAVPVTEAEPVSIAARFRVVDVRAAKGRRAEEAAKAAAAVETQPSVPPAPEPQAEMVPVLVPEPIVLPVEAPVVVAEAIVTPVPPVELPQAAAEPAMPAAYPIAEANVPPALPVSPAMPAPPAPQQVTASPRSLGLAISKPFQIQNNVSFAADEDYQLPPRTLLQEPPASTGVVVSQETLEQNAGLLESVLEDFGVRGEIIHVRPGPVVTLYEFEPAPGVKSSRVIGLADDIARSMSALSARVAVVPGRNVIGIELPNATRETVYFREMIESTDFATTGFKLPLCLGKTIGGEPVIAELAKMPHLLVAGTTGSGKSVAINTMILSLLYRLKPEECRLIMVDPKMLELSVYDGIPHLLTPVVTDPKKAVMALKWAVREMEDRYRKMSRLGVRNIDGYNVRAASARAKGETITCLVQTGFEKGTGDIIHQEQELDLAPMPYIVVIVDEMADLMMVAGKEIEGAIQRLAQMARAAGIHLIMATQRPSVDVITGTIKANFPTRISFQVTSKIDSRTILGEQGAEQLLGQGDMLHMVGGGRIVRVHGPFVSDAEVENVVAHLRSQGRPEYLDTVTEDEEEEPASAAVFDKTEMGADDGEDLYQKAVKVVLRDKKCSTSYIQRRLGIGYNRAASLVERMEKEGLVGQPNHVGKREIVRSRDIAAPVVEEDFT